MSSFVNFLVFTFFVGVTSFSSMVQAGTQYTPEFSYDFGGVICRSNTCRSFSASSGDRVILMSEIKPGIFQGEYERQFSLDGHRVKYLITATQTNFNRRSLLKYDLKIVDEDSQQSLGSSEVVVSRSQKLNLITLNGASLQRNSSVLRPYLVLGPIEDTLTTTGRAFEEQK